MDAGRLIRNETPGVALCVPMDDRHGRDVALVVLKLTYAVSAGGVVTLADPQRSVRLHDASSPHGGTSTPRYPSDLVEEKPGTDVLLVGTAHPPRTPPSSPPATGVDVSLRIEPGGDPLGPVPIRKTVRVSGPRVWTQVGSRLEPSSPGALAPTPLGWELAFGGPDDPRNPAGTGMAREMRDLVDRLTPALEDPRAPIGSAVPVPAGFGPIPTHWSPRAERAGTHDAAWYRERAPVRPVDLDPRHFCAGPDDQWSEVPLRGDEPIEILGATPEGSWRFRLPRWAPAFTSVTLGVIAPHATHLDTLLIDADERFVELCWRATIPLPRKTEMLESIWIREARTVGAPDARRAAP
jgi:hypothetical protein